MEEKKSAAGNPDTLDKKRIVILSIVGVMALAFLGVGLWLILEPDQMLADMGVDPVTGAQPKGVLGEQYEQEETGAPEYREIVTLDDFGMEKWNEGLIKYKGVALFSCRDHQFVQTTANRIIEIMPDGSIIDKITTYDEYLESDEMARKRTVYIANREDDNI